MNNTDVYLKVANSDNEKVAQAAFLLIDRLQSFKPGVQFAAITVLFTLMCEVFELHPTRLNEYISKMVWQKANRRYLPQFAAMKTYLETEVRDNAAFTRPRKQLLG